MKIKKKLFVLVVLILISACAVNANSQNLSGNTGSLVERLKTEKGVCQIRQVEKLIVGNSMSPLLQNGGTIDLLESYYRCGYPLQKNDIVAYHYGGEERPLIKIAKVLPEDVIEIQGSKMLVNGEILKNSSGRDYHFSDAELKMLSLYIKDQHIPKDTCFLFGDNTEVSTDSRKFGAVSPNDFLGKFEVETYEEPGN